MLAYFNILKISGIFFILLILTLASNLGCTKKRTPNEQLTVKRIAPYCVLLEDYRQENMYYPESWDDLLKWKNVTMPINPYTGKPMVLLSSKEFDPKLSPGNIYYMKVVLEGNVVNCQVIIFGERGEITRYQHSNKFAAK